MPDTITIRGHGASRQGVRQPHQEAHQVTQRMEGGIPVCDTSDPASLESWYGPGGFVDHLRKARLSMCAEMIRAGAAAGDSKLSEARVNDLAHTHPAYLDFLFTNLNGRRMREQNVIDSAQGGMHR